MAPGKRKREEQGLWDGGPSKNANAPARHLPIAAVALDMIGAETTT